MIKVSIFYPNDKGKKFDMNYYIDKHMTMLQEKLGAACRSMAAEQGLSGGEPGSPAIYVAMGHLYFDSIEAFQTAFTPHAEAIIGDMPNYTDIQPVIQVSEVKM